MPQSTTLRSKHLGSQEGLSIKFSRAETLDMFRRICAIRSFELKAKQAFDEKMIRCPIYLSFGQESIASALSIAFKNPVIFAQHRAHDLYLAYGGNVQALIDELLHLPTGCAKGMGGSASIHSPEIQMIGHSGLMGDHVPIAVGYALASDKRTLAVFGDAAAEEDYVLAALGYASHKKASVLFVCIDNGLSILTKVEVRRNWKMADLARAFGMEAAEITDDPWLVMHQVKELGNKLPAFMNIHTCRHFWHAGTGTDGPPEWNRFELIKEEMKKLGLEEALAIEEEEQKKISSLWDRRLEEIRRGAIKQLI